jgi:hypothetical protein
MESGVTGFKIINKPYAIAIMEIINKKALITIIKHPRYLKKL